MKSCRPDCQCPNCDPEMAAIMRMSPQQYAGWLTLNSAKMQRTLRGAELRTAIPPTPTALPPRRHAVRKTYDEWRAHFAALLGVGSIVLDVPADPYAAATASAPYAPEPDDYPGYDPYGTPPDIYLLALAAQDDTPDTHAPHRVEPTDDTSYQPHGTAPDGYAIALDSMKENR